MSERLFDVYPPWTTTAGSIIEHAIDLHRPAKTFLMFSGGNDSIVLLHYVHHYLTEFKIDGVVHVNTGTGVCEGGKFLTTEFARQVCADWGIEMVELHPPKSYEEVFIEEPCIDGLPGPGMHRIAYSRLKERAVEGLLKEAKTHRRDRIMFLTGIREDESQIRMGYGGSIIDRKGAQVWVNPLYRWTSVNMKAYREALRLPKNPVSEHLHISGECLCGSFAKPGELDEIAFFYPETAARIRGWEDAARAKGLTYCKWGDKRPGRDDPDLSPMCRNCIERREGRRHHVCQRGRGRRVPGVGVGQGSGREGGGTRGGRRRGSGQRPSLLVGRLRRRWQRHHRLPL